MAREHGFTSVDEQEDANAWVAVLDKLRSEPFYSAYKRRVTELLEPRDGAHYLDLGSGTGKDAQSISAQARCFVVAADRSVTMVAACRARGGVLALVCDAVELPFCEQMFDGCLADRTLQHLLSPEHVFRYRSDHMLRNGTIAHRVPSMFRDAGLSSIELEARTLVVRDPDAVDEVMGLRIWARTAAANQFLSTEDPDRWEELFDEMVRAGRFLYAVTFFITSGTKERSS